LAKPKRKYGQAGVAIAIENKWVDTIKEINRHTERHIDIKFKNIVISCAYAPDMNYDEQKRKDFWDKLDEKIHKNTDNKILHILCIDNNGQIGCKEKTKHIGKHTISKKKRKRQWGKPIKKTKNMGNEGDEHNKRKK